MDDVFRRAIKGVVRGLWTIEYAIRRRARPPAYALAGTCEGCAKCCEQPTIRVGWATFRVRALRALFLGWQRSVNGFELVEAVAAEVGGSGQFRFRCRHFDWEARKCRSYTSRPFMCRDYPRALLDQAWPELFEGCGYRPLAKNGERLRDELVRRGVEGERLAELEKRLFLR